jgi:hypothetical protein
MLSTPNHDLTMTTQRVSILNLSVGLMVLSALIVVAQNAIAALMGLVIVLVLSFVAIAVNSSP